MKIGFIYRDGSNCQDENCWFSLRDPANNTIKINQFVDDGKTKYIVLGGTAHLKYEIQDYANVTSNYGSTWIAAETPWIYGENVVINLEKTTKFLQIIANTNNKAEVVVIDSGEITRNMVANSFVYTMGEGPHTLTHNAGVVEVGENANVKSTTFRSPDNQTITLNSSSKLIAVYVERA